MQDNIDRSKRRKQTGEDFTPSPLVNEILDKLQEQDENIFSNPEKTFFDPACGNGQFLVHVKERLMEGLKNIIPDIIEREKHILTNQIFGIDLMKDNVISCCQRLGYEEAGILFNINARGCAVSRNILCANTLEYNSPKKLRKLFSKARKDFGDFLRRRFKNGC